MKRFTLQLLFFAVGLCFLLAAAVKLILSIDPLTLFWIGLVFLGSAAMIVWLEWRKGP